MKCAYTAQPHTCTQMIIVYLQQWALIGAHTKFTIKNDFANSFEAGFLSFVIFLHSLVLSVFITLPPPSHPPFSSYLSILFFIYISGLLFALQWNFCEWFFWCIWIDLNILCSNANCSVDFCYMDCKTVKTGLSLSLARSLVWQCTLHTHNFCFRILLLILLFQLYAFLCLCDCSWNAAQQLFSESVSCTSSLLSSHKSTMIRFLKTD